VEGDTMDSQLNVIATHVCSAAEDLYQLIDFLNRNLKEKDVIFGLSKLQKEEGKMLVTLYRSSAP
jgi:Protein of unknown function (DUF4264)